MNGKAVTTAKLPQKTSYLHPVIPMNAMRRNRHSQGGSGSRFSHLTPFRYTAHRDVSDILNPLNTAQREAVTASSGNLLVLAGAGSGKTRVLVHRIAWLIRAEGFSAHSVLAVTFTNKAAREMRGRIEDMLQMPTHGLWVGTFHGLAHRLLKAHWREAGLPQQFQILDSDDQLRVVKRICRELDLDEARWPPKQAQWFINGQKDEGLRARHVEAPEGDLYAKTMVRIYAPTRRPVNAGGWLTSRSCYYVP